jgi:hypothetical protein
MSFQNVRAELELLTAAALNDAGLTKVFYDNVSYPQTDAGTDYAVINVNFTDTVAVALQCGLNRVAGAITVLIFTRANVGARPGEDYAYGLLEDWIELLSKGYGINDLKLRLSNFDGPRMIAATDPSSHNLHNIAATFTATYP